MAHAAKPSSQLFHGRDVVWLGYLGVWAELPHSQGGLLRKAGSVHRGHFSKAVSVEEKGVFISLDGRICYFQRRWERI